MLQRAPRKIEYNLLTVCLVGARRSSPLLIFRSVLIVQGYPYNISTKVDSMSKGTSPSNIVHHLYRFLCNTSLLPTLLTINARPSSQGTNPISAPILELCDFDRFQVVVLILGHIPTCEVSQTWISISVTYDHLKARCSTMSALRGDSLRPSFAQLLPALSMDPHTPNLRVS